MKNKKFIYIGILIAAVIAIALILSNRTSSFFRVDNNDDNTISITAQKAAAESGGVGYITIAEGQDLCVRANMTDGSTVKIELLPREVDATTKVLMEENITGIDAQYFELPAGDYTIRFTAEKGAEGTMDISAKLFTGLGILIKNSLLTAVSTCAERSFFQLFNSNGSEIQHAKIILQTCGSAWTARLSSMAYKASLA